MFEEKEERDFCNFALVQARDSFGNLCQSGGNSFSVQIQGVAREDICVTDRHDGTYAVEYSVPAEGNYHVSVTLNGAHVSGSPAPITAFRSVLPAAVISLTWYGRNQRAMLASELAQAVHRQVAFSPNICWHAPKIRTQGVSVCSQA